MEELGGSMLVQPIVLVGSGAYIYNARMTSVGGERRGGVRGVGVRGVGVACALSSTRVGRFKVQGWGNSHGSEVLE